MVDYDNPPEVICGVCHKNYGKGYGSSTQGHDCAAHYDRGFIYGHYGSDFDVTKLRLTGVDLPDKVDPVCDECIRGWVYTGKAMPMGEYMDFDAFRELPVECQACKAPTPTYRERFKYSYVDSDRRPWVLSLCASCFEKKGCQVSA